VDRIGIVGESFAPVILWIGVQPASLSGDYGATVACQCRDLLVTNEIIDVEVEIRESVVTRSRGPKLYNPDFMADVRMPLSTTLGLPICAQSMTWAEGTGGFFITEGGNTKRLHLVTARQACGLSAEHAQERSLQT
jgi:hypothetical protein